MHTLPCSPKQPYDAALHWLKTQHGHHRYTDWTRLIVWQDVWYVHQRQHGQTFRIWQELQDSDVKNALWRYLGNAEWEKPDGDGGTVMVPCSPNTRIVSDIHNAAKALAVIDDTAALPVWLSGSYEEGIEIATEYGEDTETAWAEDYVATASGIFNLNTRVALQGNYLLFTLSTLPFAYQPDATCPRWGDFLRSVWGDDDDSINLLQEMFGYIVSGSNLHQKVFLLVGPPRAGKGTIAKVLERLVGPNNVAAPTMSSLGRNFGLAPLIGKSLAIVADARLDSAHRSQIQLVERLLSVSGDDEQTIDRKFMGAWHGRLQARFLILSNELPTLHDASAAVVRRLVPLQLTQSFLGKEDTALSFNLVQELPGILNWALDGWDRLREQGRFSTSPASLEMLEDIEELSSPVSAFLADCGMVGPEHEVEVSEMWRAWYRWTAMSNTYTGDQSNFGKQLKAFVPTLKKVRRGEGKGRYAVYRGVGLLPHVLEKVQASGL